MHGLRLNLIWKCYPSHTEEVCGLIVAYGDISTESVINLNIVKLTHHTLKGYTSVKMKN